MRCPSCGFRESKVLDSRPAEDGAVIRRRRECLGCHMRFTSHERVESRPFVVVKKDGRREGFDAAKILAGLMTACEKRPVPVPDLERLVADVERELRSRFERECPSREVGEAVMRRLQGVDSVAYVRFASVYRQFQDLQRFRDELEGLLQGRREADPERSGPAPQA